MDPKPMKTPDLSGLLKARPRQLRRTGASRGTSHPAGADLSRTHQGDTPPPRTSRRLASRRGDISQRAGRETYVEADRKVTRRGGAVSHSTIAGSGRRSKQHLTSIRDWARKKGYTVSERGRIPGDVLDALRRRSLARVTGLLLALMGPAAAKPGVRAGWLAYHADMKPLARRLRSVLVATGAACVVISTMLSVAPAAHAAPTIGGGDCWRSTTERSCWAHWSDGQPILFTAYEDFPSQPGWHTSFIYALQNWNTAAGPQSLSTAYRANSGSIRYSARVTGQNGLTSQAYGITWNCSSVGSYCSSTTTENLLVGSANIYINSSTLAGVSRPLQTAVFAHETGHALLLAHTYSRSGDLMFPAIYDPPVTDHPIENGDIGALPPCNGSLGSTNSNNDRAGTRCVYHWPS